MCCQTVGYTLLMELQWIRDPQAIDVTVSMSEQEPEGLPKESWQLNPHGPVAHALPGEVFISVGQNPKVGSSIRQTQHTQLAEGHWNKYPILKVDAARVFAAKVEQLNDVLGPRTMLEIVDINPEAESESMNQKGGDPENMGLMLRCRCPDIPPGLIRFLTQLGAWQLRLRLLERLGGPEAIETQQGKSDSEFGKALCFPILEGWTWLDMAGPSEMLSNRLKLNPLNPPMKIQDDVMTM
eukprot:Skav201309  [mRNA]  locus=scaffold1490:80725:83427:- [translate_table: standard]